MQLNPKLTREIPGCPSARPHVPARHPARLLPAMRLAIRRYLRWGLRGLLFVLCWVLRGGQAGLFIVLRACCASVRAVRWWDVVKWVHLCVFHRVFRRFQSVLLLLWPLSWGFRGVWRPFGGQKRSGSARKHPTTQMKLARPQCHQKHPTCHLQHPDFHWKRPQKYTKKHLKQP